MGKSSLCSTFFVNSQRLKKKICKHVFMKGTLRVAGKGVPAARPYGVRIGGPGRAEVGLSSLRQSHPTDRTRGFAPNGVDNMK